jgi:glycopeptide antibiotics resistance protein
VATLLGCKVYGADLCGGTGGNGQIISVGNNAFTMKRNDDGSSQIIYLAGQATIETLTGFVSLSDLKIGERVTLVGGPNSDGSFTADAVVVCSGTGQATSIVVRNNDSNYEKVSVAINVATMLLVGLVWLGAVMFFWLKKKKGAVYLIFFTMFYVYIIKVFDYTLFQFQSLLVLKYFMPSVILNGLTAVKSVNLIPLATLTFHDLRISLLNILLFIPFGFGLPFITNFRFKKVVFIGALFSVGIEFLQLATGFIANITFRVTDINDVIFNTVGAIIGYILFVVFVRVYRRVFRNWKMSVNPILRYIAERPQI